MTDLYSFRVTLGSDLFVAEALVNFAGVGLFLGLFLGPLVGDGLAFLDEDAKDEDGDGCDCIALDFGDASFSFCFKAALRLSVNEGIRSRLRIYR